MHTYLHRANFYNDQGNSRFEIGSLGRFEDHPYEPGAILL